MYISIASLVLVSVAVVDASIADTRQWKDASGAFSVEAEFVWRTDTEVALKAKSGELLTISISKLSSADQTFVKQLPLLRTWTITETNQEVEAAIVGGESGIIELKKRDGGVVSVAIDSLAGADRQYAYSKLGARLLSFSGVWRSDSGSYYAISDGNDGKVYARLLQSSHLVSAVGVLHRQGDRLVSEQWLTALRDDPKQRVRSGAFEIFTTPDGSVRSRYDYFTWDRNGNEVPGSRKKVNGSFVRLDGEQIPKDVFDLFVGRKVGGPEDVYEDALRKMVTVIGVHWYGKQRKVSIQDAVEGRGPTETPGLGELLVNAASVSVRNRILSGVLDSLFPIFNDRERKVAQAVTMEYLEARTILQLTDRRFVESWTREQIDGRLRGTSLSADTMSHFVRFVADFHDRVRQSWVAVLPD